MKHWEISQVIKTLKLVQVPPKTTNIYMLVTKIDLDEIKNPLII